METKNASKIAREETGVDGDDRLSSLPEEIISHVLSFLETKYAVGTAVLSRRWKDLWARVSSLDLDSGLVFKPLSLETGLKISPDPASAFRARDLEFSRFVDRVLSQHKNLDSLRRFRFHFSVTWEILPPPDFRFTREFVFGPLLEEIDVMLSEETTEFGLPQCMRRIPHSFYTLKNLKIAKLERVTLSAPKGSVLLPCMKILLLVHVRMMEFETLVRLIAGCPVLETAHLVNCIPSYTTENDILDVSLPCLKNLKIWDYDDVWERKQRMCPVVIEAPNLEQLYFDVLGDFPFKGRRPLPCLQTVYVAVDDRGRASHSLAGFLSRISNAKEISLLGKTLSHLSVEKNVQLPDLPNLTHLVIEIEGSSCVLRSLLNSATKLQYVYIVMGNCSGPVECDWRSQPATGPECFLSSLRVITIYDFVAVEAQIAMVAYFLTAGAILEKLILHFYSNDTDGYKPLVPLLNSPRRSSSCEIRLFRPNKEEIHIEQP
ncbi:unnamed protein product [Linum trigynum]|uniref:F-box domain-containing protein n=1 Tax=Linum trigynum TaxID=586398 RepID=A0AAV2EI29_9ROSI